MAKKKQQIGQILTGHKVISLQQLETALEEQARTGEYLCKVLIRLGFVKEEDVLPVLAKQLDVEFVKLKQIEIGPEVIKIVPAKFVSHYKLMPVELKEMS